MKAIIEHFPKPENLSYFLRLQDLIEKSENEDQLRESIRQTNALHGFQMEHNLEYYENDHKLTTDEIRYGFGHNHFWASEKCMIGYTNEIGDSHLGEHWVRILFCDFTEVPVELSELTFNLSK